MKTLILRPLAAGLLMGFSISFVSGVTLFKKATRCDPPISEDEFRPMGNLPMSQVEATLAKRRITLTRWEWLRDSVRYSYFWKQVARDGLVSTVGVVLGCLWVGWMQGRTHSAVKPTHQSEISATPLQSDL